MERTRHRLNEATPGVTSCAWPNCKDAMIRGGVNRNGIEIPGLRVGVLCMPHARQVAEAVFEDQVWAAQFHQAFGQKQEPVDLRSLDKMQREERQAAANEERKAGRPGFVYYIRVDERVKIGYSVDVRRRMKAYPPASKLLAVEPGTREIERQRHRQFAGSLAYGREWFTETVDLREHIDALLAEHGAPPSYMAHHYTTKRQPMRISRRP